jgi:hypothetical protein
MHADHLFAQRSQGLRLRRRVHGVHDDRDRRELAVTIGGGELRVAEPGWRAVLELPCLGTHHQVREVDVPRMRRNVWTLHHVAHVAEVALVDHLLESLATNLLELARRRCVDEVEERRNALQRLTQRRHP